VRRRPPGPRRPPRRAWGQRWRDADYVALDFEATGLDLARDRIISFGAVPMGRGRIQVGHARYQTVDPGDRPPSPRSVTVHGIRPVDLRGAPTQDAAVAALREVLADRFLVAWYGRIEVGFLATLFRPTADRFSRTMVDVRDLMLALEGPAAEERSLSSAADRYGVPVADPHHALDDALVTAQLFFVVGERLARRDGLSSVGDLLRVRDRVAPPSRR
jgi:DNA polymerase III subunit epsilon